MTSSRNCAGVCGPVNDLWIEGAPNAVLFHWKGNPLEPPVNAGFTFVEGPVVVETEDLGLCNDGPDPAP